MFFSRNELFIAFPIIRTKARYIHIHWIKFFPEFFARLCGAVATDKIEIFFSKSINSNPYPTVVFF
jgi:hypothetical protein